MSVTDLRGETMEGKIVNGTSICAFKVAIHFLYVHTQVPMVNYKLGEKQILHGLKTY